jgi:hypothetical protein
MVTTSKVPFVITTNSAATVIKGKPFSMDASHPLFGKFTSCLKKGDVDAVVRMLDNQEEMIKLRVAMAKSGAGGVVVKNRSVYYNGEMIDSSLTNHMLKMLDAGENIDPMRKFLSNVMLNPSQTAIMELYDWVVSGNFAITTDGHFLAYKKVKRGANGKLVDCYTGTIDHTPGKKPEMPRTAVDPDRDNTCSRGLHFCSRSYLSNYSGDVVIIVKVHPADVIAIPSDYSNTKGRACQYEVLAEYGKAKEVEMKELFTKPVMRPGDLPFDKHGNKIKKVAKSKVKTLPTNQTAKQKAAKPKLVTNKVPSKPKKGTSYFDNVRKCFKVWDGQRWRPRKTDPKKAK